MVDELPSLLRCYVCPDKVGEEFPMRCLHGSGNWLNLLNFVFNG